MTEMEEDAGALVMLTDNEDGSARATVQFADEDHRFSVNIDGSRAHIEYEETLSWRGRIRVKEPEEAVYRELMASDAMTDYLNEHDLSGVSRKRH